MKVPGFAWWRWLKARSSSERAWLVVLSVWTVLTLISPSENIGGLLAAAALFMVLRLKLRVERLIRFVGRQEPSCPTCGTTSSGHRH